MIKEDKNKMGTNANKTDTSGEWLSDTHLSTTEGKTVETVWVLKNLNTST